MESRANDTFITISIIFVAVKLMGCDTNEKWYNNEGFENRVPVISYSVSMSIKLHESHHEFTFYFMNATPTILFIITPAFSCIIKYQLITTTPCTPILQRPDLEILTQHQLDT